MEFERVLQGQRLRIAWVIPGSGAAAADLRVGDLITAVAGRPVVSREALTRILVRHAAGERISVALRRGRDEVSAEVELGLLAPPTPVEP